MKASRRRTAVAAALLAGLLGCSTAGGGGGTGSSRAGGSTTSTSTTTTLPTPVVIGGTQPAGTMSFLGTVMRVAVQPLAGTVTAGTVTIGFRQFGSGPDLLLLMGQSGSMSWWDPNFLQALEQHFRVTIFDLPSVGYSGPDSGAAPSIGRYADVAAGLVGALGLRQPVLLGWGMGGEVALEVLVRHPGLAARAVLADTSAGGPTAVATPSAAERQLAAPGSTTELLAGLLFPGAASTERDAWLAATGTVAPDDVLPAALAGEAAAQDRWWTTGGTPAQLKDLGAPVMVLWGADDGVFPPADGSALAAAVPGDTVLTLSGNGYGALFASQATVVPAITAFAQSH